MGRGGIAAIALTFAAAALLSVNERRFPRPFLRCSRVSELAAWLKDPLWLSFLWVNPAFLGWMGAPILTGIGLFFFVPAFALWLWSYADLLARR